MLQLLFVLLHCSNKRTWSANGVAANPVTRKHEVQPHLQVAFEEAAERKTCKDSPDDLSSAFLRQVKAALDLEQQNESSISNKSRPQKSCFK